MNELELLRTTLDEQLERVKRLYAKAARSTNPEQAKSILLELQSMLAEQESVHGLITKLVMEQGQTSVRANLWKTSADFKLKEIRKDITELLNHKGEEQ